MGRSGLDPSGGPACGPGRGEKERSALGSRLGRREEEEENAPVLLLGSTAPVGSAGARSLLAVFCLLSPHQPTFSFLDEPKRSPF